MRVGSVFRHVRHHVPFYISASFGIAIWLSASVQAPALRWVAAGDGFFALYLMVAIVIAARATSADMRRRASFADAGIGLIILITLAAVVLSLASIFELLQQKLGTVQLVLAVASVPLGWLTLHTVAGFHYAQLYCAQTTDNASGRKTRDVGGLDFPETTDPTYWDFLYHAFVVGMTAQVSDVRVISSAMRRLVLAHGVVSFFYNTVILALTVAVAAGPPR